MIVVDTNVIAHFFLPSDLSSIAEKAMHKDGDWIAPRLWRSEFRNVLANHFRVQRISLAAALDTIGRAEDLFRDREYDVPSAAVLGLSHRSLASAYDCEFVALAQQLEVPLITSDAKLATAFPETAISLQRFVAG